MSLPELGNKDSSGRLTQPTDYSDGRTKQAYADDADINKIMARADKAGTISHLQKYEGVYADYSDYDFAKQTNMLSKGASIFDELPAELRQEFGQSPAAFFKYVNDPANVDLLDKKLPALAEPGRQILRVTPATADEKKAAEAAESEPASVTATPASEGVVTPTGGPEAT